MTRYVIRAWTLPKGQYVSLTSDPRKESLTVDAKDQNDLRAKIIRIAGWPKRKGLHSLMVDAYTHGGTREVGSLTISLLGPMNGSETYTWTDTRGRKQVVDPRTGRLTGAYSPDGAYWDRVMRSEASRIAGGRSRPEYVRRRMP